MYVRLFLRWFDLFDLFCFDAFADCALLGLDVCLCGLLTCV